LKNVGGARDNFGGAAPRYIEQTSAARRKIFQSDQRIDSIPIIASGWAAAIANSGHDRRQTIALLLPGDLVSSALVFDDKLNVTVEAITDVCCHNYARAEFRAALAANPNLFEAVLRSWAEESLQVAQLAVSLGQCTAEERIARLIVNLFERLAKRGMVENDAFDCPLRQWHIAEYTGLTAVHVSKVLGQLRRDGLIDFKDRVLTILNPVALRRICNI
jgi:CRP/FNR family transcriptional regulator, anaerobic regulatory protein